MFGVGLGIGVAFGVVLIRLTWGCLLILLAGVFVGCVLVCL